MAHIIMLVPAVLNAGVKTISCGLFEALINKNVRAAILPQFDQETLEQSLLAGRSEIFKQCEPAAYNKDVVLINGFPLTNSYAGELNFALATALDAAVIFVTLGQNLPNDLCQLKITAKPYQNRYPRKILGAIINKANAVEVTSWSLEMPLLDVIPHKNELMERGSDLYLGKIISKYFNLNWLWPFLNNVVEQAFTPLRFRHRLFSEAKRANKKIVLPEGEEPRTLQAANICETAGIAHCVLLGRRQEIYNQCAKYNIKLNENIEIIEPQQVLAKYVEPLCAARRNKGLTPLEATQQLAESTVLGTMMLHLGEVDGLVSGAIHTTADTIRPALQIIKTVSNIKLVSSIFFMCLPDQVLVYGDCAINQNPDAQTLADIAIQSAASAAAFGITPRVAMLSYSTGNSGSGPDVDKVKQATEIVKKLQPRLSVDGPLQYDAAIDSAVAALKAPKSNVAGKATVFVFPDLNAGNIAYKAVQRSAGIVCVGPMLQGLRKPVNDLSRGCSVEDIVFTIAITAVQAIT